MHFRRVTAGDPFTHATSTVAPSGEEGVAPSRVHDILVIEDDPSTSQMLQLMLQDEGYTVDVAPDGDEGLALLQHRRYRLLLLDLMLPGLDGLGALRAEPALRPPVVVVLCAPHRPADVLAAIEAGADDYLTKPFDVHDLTLRVALWLRRPGAPTGAPGLRVHSLGRFGVEYEGQSRLREGGRTRKANTLFKYLLTHQDRTVTVAEVVDLFWPHTPEYLTATSLRSLLYQLRRRLHFPVQGRLEHTSTTLALRLRRDDWWDVAQFRAWLSEGDQWRRVGQGARAIEAYAAGVALYAGDYLAEDGDADWFRPLRARLREDWLRALSTMALLHAERGEHEKQEGLLRTVLRADPYREPGYRALMDLFAARGRSTEALVLYRQLESLLRAEFGAGPDPETQNLALRIGQAAGSDEPAALMRHISR